MRRPVRPGFDQLEDRCLLSGGPWQEMTAPAGFTPGGMILLPNGNVLVQEANGNNWMQLQPDASGNYANGTWPANLTSTMPADASGATARNTYDSTVLPDGRLFALGGEYASTGKAYLDSGLIYDPTATDPATGHLGTWTLTKPAPIVSLGQPYLGDAPLALLPDGNVLVGNNNGPAVHNGGDLTLLSAAADASQTTLDVYNFGHPAVPFFIDVEHEILSVTHVDSTGTVWTVQRGQQGTTAIAHGNGASVDLISNLAPAGIDATTTSIPVTSSAGFPSLNPTTLTAAVGADPTATTIQVASTAGFPIGNPLYPFQLQVGQEMMTVTNVGGKTLTVIRGTHGTTPVAHAGGEAVTTPYYVQLDQEIVFVTAVSADGLTLTVQRGALGTAAVAHAGGTAVHLSSDYAETLIFDPTTGDWTTQPVTSDKLNNDSSFEEGWFKIPGPAGNILSYSNNATFEYNSSQAQVYSPATKTWTSTGPVPVVLTENVFSNESGPGLQLPDGRIFEIGADGDTALYNPAANSWTAGPQVTEHLTTLAQPIADTSPGTIEVTSGANAPATPFFIEIGQEVLKVTKVAADGTTWTVRRAQYLSTAATHAAGADVVQLFIPGDQPAAELPDGKILFNAGQQIETAPTTFFQYDPQTNALAPLDTSVMPKDLQSYAANNADDGSSLLMLPTGQALFTDGVDNHLYVYTPPGAAPASSRPTVAAVADDGDGTFTLSGTQLNGISEGATYGDDQGMSENYPLVQLTASDGTVSYARTFDWSSTAVATGATPETTRFTLPPGTAPGTYTLSVVAAGIGSQPFAFTVTPQEATASGITLTYDGPGTAATLAEASAGTDNVTVSEVGPGRLQIDLNGADFAAGSTTSATGLTYQHPGSPATSTFATLDVGTANDVSVLKANLPDHALTLGAIPNASGGLASLDLTAASLTVAGAVNTTAATGTGTGAVILRAAGALTVQAGQTVHTKDGSIQLQAGAVTLPAGATVEADAAEVKITSSPSAPGKGGSVLLDGAVMGTAVQVQGSAQGDSVTVNTTGSSPLTIDGSSGADSITITPSSTTPITVNGGGGAGSAGDGLDVLLAGATNPVLTITADNAGSRSGTLTFDDRKTVTFSNIESLTPATVDLSVTAAAVGSPAAPGATVTYTVTATNHGTVGVTGVTVNDQPPRGPGAYTSVTYTRTFSSANSGSSTPASGTGPVNDTVNLAAGDSVTYVIAAVVGPSASGTLGDTAAVIVPAGVTDSDPTNNAFTVPVTVIPPGGGTGSTPPGGGPTGTAPPPPVTGEVTALVGMTLTVPPGGKKHRSSWLSKALTLSNNGSVPLQGPFNVVLVGLRRTVKVRGASGFVGTGKKKRPFFAVTVPGGMLQPGQSVVIALRFGQKPNHFTVSVFADAAPQ